MIQYIDSLLHVTDTHNIHPSLVLSIYMTPGWLALESVSYTEGKIIFSKIGQIFCNQVLPWVPASSELLSTNLRRCVGLVMFHDGELLLPCSLYVFVNWILRICFGARGELGKAYDGVQINTRGKSHMLPEPKLYVDHNIIVSQMSSSILSKPCKRSSQMSPVQGSEIGIGETTCRWFCIKTYI